MDTRRKLNPLVRKWLSTPDPDESDPEADAFYDRWLLERMGSGSLLSVDRILVDRDVLTARFACLPDLCSPARSRGSKKSCCADLSVYLVDDERRRLLKREAELRTILAGREPRLARLMKKTRPFFLDADEIALARPERRCVFSALDSELRIRCHLHSIARALKVERNEIQPITCRLFPLVLVRLHGGQVLVTVLNARNYRAWGGGRHPKSFPCLEQPALPPLLKTMGPTLDWLFGEGFALSLSRLGRRL